MALFDRLQAQGNTIVLVTHEHDIAEYAHRVVYIASRRIYKRWSGRERRKESGEVGQLVVASLS
jgi:putative ABC transport system ATP-binding protein